MIRRRGFVVAMSCAFGCGLLGPESDEYAPQPWTRISSIGSPGNFYDMHFSGLSNGWVVADRGRIFRTTDGGKRWSLAFEDTSRKLRSIAFAGSTGWVGGDRGAVGRTTNGGQSWTWLLECADSACFVLAIACPGSSTCFVTDNRGRTRRTFDAGATWTEQETMSDWAITSIFFSDNDNGWMTSTNRELFHTSNSGASWVRVDVEDACASLGGTPIFTDVFARWDGQAWVVTNMAASSIANPEAGVLHTQDGGVNWTATSVSGSIGLNAIEFINERTGWAAGLGGLYRSTDSGNVWIKEPGVAGNVVDICFHYLEGGWALTIDGAIYAMKYTH